MLDYNAHPHGLTQAIEFLINGVDSKVNQTIIYLVFSALLNASQSEAFITNVEARRNALESFPLILQNVLPHIARRASSCVTHMAHG